MKYKVLPGSDLYTQLLQLKTEHCHLNNVETDSIITELVYKAKIDDDSSNKQCLAIHYVREFILLDISSYFLNYEPVPGMIEILESEFNSLLKINLIQQKPTPIKVRAFIHSTKEMIYDVQDAYKGHTGDPHPLEVKFALSFGELMTLEENGMQHHTTMLFSTLYTAKDNTPVYKADIIKFTLPDIKETGKEQTYTTYMEVVDFIDGCFVLDGCPLYVVLETECQAEVIGNIYEHPHLIPELKYVKSRIIYEAP